MRTRTIAVVGAIGLLLALGFLVLRSPPVTTRAQLPKPNGYDDFLRAGQLLGNLPQNLDDLTLEQLKAMVARNAAALREVRVGFQRQCRVPLGYSTTYSATHMADLSICKQIVRAFVMEGKLAETESRSQDAAASYLDAIRFGHECSRGGVIIDMLVGVACQSIGSQKLQALVGQLKAADCRHAIQQMEDMDFKAESGQEVANQERAWSKRTFGWRGQVLLLVQRGNLQRNAQQALAKLPAQQRVARSLMIDLAERAYELEHGESPKSIGDLVPAYLKASPRDPLDPSKVMNLPSAPNHRKGNRIDAAKPVQFAGVRR